jgi:hypothetical protein
MIFDELYFIFISQRYFATWTSNSILNLDVTPIPLSAKSLLNRRSQLFPHSIMSKTQINLDNHTKPIRRTQLSNSIRTSTAPYSGTKNK